MKEYNVVSKNIISTKTNDIIFKTHILKIDTKGNIIEDTNLDNIIENEKIKIIHNVFTQGLKRLGYDRI